MFYIAIGLFIVALLVLIADIFIEGFGPLAVVGLVGILVSMVLTAFWVPLGGFIVLGKIAVTVPGVWLLFRFLRKRQLDGKFILNETLAEDVAPVGGLEYFLGKEGMTKTALRPQGFADFNGQNIEVASDSGFIPTGKRVKVVDVQSRKVLVRLIEN
jgi:membrane-bound serine protease (ClpP class)